MIRKPDNTEAELTNLDQRVERLESAVTALSDTQLMEDRVADRVVTRLKRDKVGDGSAPTAAFASPAEQQSGWFLKELWTECRYFVRMLSDHRYPFSFWTRVGPFAVLGVYLFSYYVIDPIPGIGWIVDRAIAIVLAVILYKILSREVARYRGMFGP
jgi:hypothetical protein